ncbi:MAG TPA: hypothetical protein GXZ32_07420 [Clostridiales bacterium]|nr:hypothetical protein [Clostridiales bacterium]
MKRLKIYILLALILLVFIHGTGCSQFFRRPREQNQQQQQQQKKDPPKSLLSMEEQTDSIIKQIQNIKEQRQKIEKQQAQDNGLAQKTEQQGQQEQQEKEGQESEKQGQQKKQGQGEGQQEQGKQQSRQQKKPEIDWTGFDTKIQALHSQWNSFEPQAKRDGAGNRLISDFEVQLDALTRQVTARNESQTLLAANKLYQYFPKFLNLYKHHAPPECKEVKYYVQQVILYGQEDDWENAEQLLPDIRDAWERAKGKMQTPDKNLNEKIDYAVDDFIRVVGQKDLVLVKLKADILLKNLQTIK